MAEDLFIEESNDENLWITSRRFGTAIAVCKEVDGKWFVAEDDSFGGQIGPFSFKTSGPKAFLRTVASKCLAWALYSVVSGEIAVMCHRAVHQYRRGLRRDCAILQRHGGTGAPRCSVRES